MFTKSDSQLWWMHITVQLEITQRAKYEYIEISFGRITIQLFSHWSPADYLDVRYMICTEEVNSIQNTYLLVC